MKPIEGCGEISTRLIYLLRCSICEHLITWALAVCPHDYVPSTVQSAVNEYRRGLREGALRR